MIILCDPGPGVRERLRACLPGPVTELESPHLLSNDQVVTPARKAEVDVEADVACLLAALQRCLERGASLPWQGVLPIYPTSPVGPV